MEEEAHVQLIGGGEGRRCRVGEELECHGGGVVGDAVKVGVGGCEVREAEEGLEAAVGTELDVDGCFSGTGYCCVEGLNDLSGDGCAGDGADGVGGVVGEIVFVGVG